MFIWHPHAALSFFVAMAKASAKILRAIYEQRRFKIGRNVKIAHDVRIVGSGVVRIGRDARICNGVIFHADQNSLIEIGSNSSIGPGSVLEANEGQVLKLGRNFLMGARCHVVSQKGIYWDDDGVLGSDSDVGPCENGARGVLAVGKNCHFNRNNVIDLCDNVLVGDNVQTGPLFSIYTHNHVPAPGKLISDQEPFFEAVHIGSGVWIGHGCIVLPGTSIGDNAVIAAGAIVTKSVQPWTIVGGVPARQLRTIA